MKSKLTFLHLALLCLLFSLCPATAAVYYVNASNPAPVSPFADWASAATNIQDAIDLTATGDTVLVTNGIYGFGGRIMAGDLLNRVALTNAIAVQSVSGPWVTTILGAGATNGAAAVRCAWLTNGASLIGFTLTAGATRNSGDAATLESGGGVWCASSNALVGNCLIVSNTAYQYGAGVYQGTVMNALLTSNSTSGSGSAAYKTVLNNCTIVSNATYGVVSPIAMTNCIIYFNNLGNISSGGSANSHCCTTPALAGTGNITNAPQLFADGIRLAPNSPCIGAGVNTATGTDIFGQTWSTPPSIGCAEWSPALVILPQITEQFSPGGIALSINADGQPPFVCTWTKDAVPIQSNGHYSSANSTTLQIGSVSLSDAGAYQVVVSNSFGVATSAVLQVSAHCVSSVGAALAPYSDWTTAATNIQDAITVAQAGDFILVTNGIYNYGGKVMAGDLNNRVALDKAVLVQSVNGPCTTSILGNGATNGTAAVRCAWLTNGAALFGFTLRAGATRYDGSTALSCGGGAWCSSSNALVGNCLIVSNTATQYGGGVYQGTIVSSLLSSNGNGSVSGGAAYSAILNDCTIISNATYGVASPLAMTNCIVYYNYLANVSGSGSAFANCCTTPTLTGTGNITNAPQIFADGVHLNTNSPCIGAGLNLAAGTDLFGQVWSNPPAIGCTEWQPSPIVSTPQIRLSGDPAGFIVNSAFSGLSPVHFFWLKDGVPLQDNGHFIASQTPNLITSGANLADMGGFQLVVSNSFGMVTSSVVQLTVHCVDINGANPTPPYSTWDTAATNIQDAIAVAAVGEIVLVTNGLYATGGKSMDGVITNRVSVDKAILVQSVNGPNATVIQGAWDPTAINGPGAMRCAWLTTNAILGGFTLRGGATRASGTIGLSVDGGGIWGVRTNTSPAAIAANCIIVSNAASDSGGGAFQVNLNYCNLATNFVSSGSGGGAGWCNLKNCILTGNMATNLASGSGGGAYYCYLTNCAVAKNGAISYGGGAYLSTLINCTVVGNQVGTSTIGYGGGVSSCTLGNCIVYQNSDRASGNSSTSNSYSSTFGYSCTAPAATGTGNIASDPLILADGIHLSAYSPCFRAGNPSLVSGTDIDGQPWNNPPSIGCDQWQFAPLIVVQPAFQIGLPAHGLTCGVAAAGQPPFACFWTKDGTPVQDDGHYDNSATPYLVVNNFGPDDAGFYQVVVTNSAGTATSQIAQLVIHAVNAAGTSPVAPYSSWATAATNIQDAINAASIGDVVLVTNGLYSSGGKVMSGDLTNRVALDKPITVTSAGGSAVTVIQGIPTTGPGAVRCAWLADGSVLNGFTLQNGATRASGDSYGGGPLESGGGIYCTSTNGLAVDCVLTNNSAIYGGGIVNGMFNNSLVTANHANYGGGAYNTALNNCSVLNNYIPGISQGAGIYGGSARNSIILGNYDFASAFPLDNYRSSTGIYQISYSCTDPIPSGTGNTNANPLFMDSIHIAASSPCRGAGSVLYASGTDVDGEPWANPPSMGCDEVVISNLTGPLSAHILATSTNLLVTRTVALSGMITGRASSANWTFGDGTTVTNTGAVAIHSWTNSGDYTVTFTVFNTDNPAGVSASTVIHVQPLNPPQMQSAGIVAGAFQLQFPGQTNANYTVQYSTNLSQPGAWQTLQSIYFNQSSSIQISDPVSTNTARFYRVLVQ